MVGFPLQVLAVNIFLGIALKASKVTNETDDNILLQLSENAESALKHDGIVLQV